MGAARRLSGRPQAAPRLAQLREAALRDAEGQALRQALQAMDLAT